MNLFCDGANGAAAAAVVVAVPVVAVAAEEEAERVVAVDLVQRARPVEAVRAMVVDLRAVAVARSGEKDRVSIRTSNLSAADTIDRSPFPRTLVAEFLDFFFSWHTPRTAPIVRCSIVGRSQVII